jgi:hypothetical protein
MEDPQGDGAWGIEISLALKSAAAPAMFSNQAQQGMALPALGTDIFRRSSIVVEVGSSSVTTPLAGQFPHHTLPAVPHRTLPPRHVPTTSSSVRISPIKLDGTLANKTRPADKGKSIPGKKKAHHHAHSHNQADEHGSGNGPLSSVDTNTASRSSAHLVQKVKSNSSDSSSESFPTDIPAALYTNPESLTKEQAHRLLASPAFLNMLERMTGSNLQGKRKSDKEQGGSVKKARSEQPKKLDAKGEELKCWNCGRTKSAVWRSKVMDDGTSVRVCNGESPPRR